jgi:hypothetical protein
MESERRDALAVSARAIASLRLDYSPPPHRRDRVHRSESSTIESMRDDLSIVEVNIFKGIVQSFLKSGNRGARPLRRRAKRSQING